MYHIFRKFCILIVQNCNPIYQMNIFRPYLFIILFFGCSKQPSELDLLNKEYPQGNYGNRMEKGIPNRVNEVLKNPDEYLSKNVLVSGVIDDVCPLRGCWIQISDKNQTGSIRVKVTDGEIVFPLSAKNHNVTVQGTFVRLDLSKDQAINWKVHLAKEKGVELDPNDIVLQKEDYYEYRINCTGAKVL